MAIIPLIQPNPPKLTDMIDAVARIEASGIYSNNGPVVRRLERELISTLFGGVGGVVTTPNCTLGLMLALRHARQGLPARRKLALMPSFTFAATAQAALWAGYKPLLCDIEPDRWTASEASEELLLKRYGDRIAAIVPYATFGAPVDLDRYAALGRKYNVQIVVDAASSLGSQDLDGRNFGAGSSCTIVYSMHATKTFAAGEGGVIYSTDAQRLSELRNMANFGFGEPRTATMPGLNAKLTEIGGLLALGKLQEIEAVVAHRQKLAACYRAELEDAFTFQAASPGQQALQFMPVLLPTRHAPERAAIIARLAAQGIGAGAYFSPHLAEQDFISANSLAGNLRVTRAIAARALSLPIYDTMTEDEVLCVTRALRAACGLEAECIKLPRWAEPAASLPLLRAHG